SPPRASPRRLRKDDRPANRRLGKRTCRIPCSSSLGCNPLMGSIDFYQGGEQASEARRSQWLVRLFGQTTEPLDRRNRVMADAIDRKEHLISAVHETGKQCCAMFDAAVVMQKARTGTLDQSLELRNLMCATAHIQQCSAVEIEDICKAIGFRSG